MNKPLYWRHKLNPANSLFGKIFIWFWLSVSMLLIAAFLLARLTRQPIDVSQANIDQLSKAERVSESVQNAANRGIPIKRALGRVANRGKWQLLLVNVERQDVILGFPAPLLSSRAPIMELAESSQILLITTPTLEFIGPFDITIGNESYKLFVGRLLRRDERPPVSWGVGLFFILGLGSLLCLFLAWRLSKPLGELGAVSRAFAAGDLQSRIHSQDNRQDEIGRLAADFNAMADKLNASMQHQHMLLANVSHELRTPLTRLQLAAGMLQDKYKEEEYLTRIELEIATMDELIGQILMLTRMQNEKSGLIPMVQERFKPCTLSDLLCAPIDSVRFEAQAMDKQLLCSEIPSIQLCVNTHALASAFENITRNAIKFAASKVYVRFELEENSVSIFVDDDGKGLPADQLSKLFEPFYQAQNTSNNGLSGAGLGLAIAKAAVNLHDGELSVDHSAEGGLRFTIRLPKKTSL